LSTPLLDRRRRPATEAVGVVVPAHDEEELLPSCLEHLGAALGAPGLADLRIRVAIVLDGCTDRSIQTAELFVEQIAMGAADHRALIVKIASRNVGMARAAGFDAVRDALDGADPDRTWLATTDADSRVPPGWLVHQLRLHGVGVEAWAGTVSVDEWEGRSPAVCRRYRDEYAADRHGHVHGANLAFSLGAYRRAGGVPPLATGEDRAMWRALVASGAAAIHDPHCPVVTSARRWARAPHGFAEVINRLEDAG
jgi:glycosyltransferase involved in cell wall biosynthesis